MRGSGIQVARLLLDPPRSASCRNLGKAAVVALRSALREPSQMAKIAERLEEPVADDETTRALEPEEGAAWELAADERLGNLADSLCVHSEGVMCQSGTASTAKVWAFRNLITLEVCAHALRCAWEATSTPASERYLLLSVGGPPRAQNFVRQRSEQSYQHARMRLREAIIVTLAQEMEDLGDERAASVDWNSAFEKRSELSDIARELLTATGREQYSALARSTFERANYGRPVEGFRVLLESLGILRGTGAYRFLAASSDLMYALVGALSAEMPMTAQDFFQRIFDRWGLVVSPDAAAGTSLATKLDGSELARNARRTERLLVETGLAVSLSDSTTVVGERIKRSRGSR